MSKLHSILIVSLVAGCSAVSNDYEDRDRSTVTLGEAATEGEGTAGDDGAGDANCTLTQGYWKNHPESWPLPLDSTLCDQSYPEIFTTPPAGDVWYVLAHQWLAATLNVAAGAEADAAVSDALAQGQALLEACVIAPEDSETAIALSVTLDEFNNGLIGPGHCDDNDKGDGGDDGDAGDDGDDGGSDEDGCNEDTGGDGADEGDDGAGDDDGCDDGSCNEEGGSADSGDDGGSADGGDAGDDGGSADGGDDGSTPSDTGDVPIPG